MQVRTYDNAVKWMFEVDPPLPRDLSEKEKLFAEEIAAGHDVDTTDPDLREFIDKVRAFNRRAPISDH